MVFFFIDFIAKQVVEAVAARTGEDDAEVKDTFLKGARDLQERCAGSKLDGSRHHEVADEEEGHRAVEQAEQDEEPAERLRQAGKQSEERREDMDAECAHHRTECHPPLRAAQELRHAMPDEGNADQDAEDEQADVLLRRDDAINVLQ